MRFELKSIEWKSQVVSENVFFFKFQNCLNGKLTFVLIQFQMLSLSYFSPYFEFKNIWNSNQLSGYESIYEPNWHRRVHEQSPLKDSVVIYSRNNNLREPMALEFVTELITSKLNNLFWP